MSILSVCHRHETLVFIYVSTETQTVCTGKAPETLFGCLLQFLDPDTVACASRNPTVLGATGRDVVFSEQFRPIHCPLDYKHTRLNVEEWMGWLDWSKA